MSAGERAEKHQRVVALLDAHTLDALILRRPGNVAWYSGGGRAHVVAVQEAGVAALVVRRDGVEVVTAVNEARRLEGEELGDLGATFRVLPWDEDASAALPRGEAIGVDGPLAGAQDVSAAVEAARRSLTEAEVERFRQLGRDAAEALTDACHELDPVASEHAAAARAAAALVSRGIDPIVLLVAGEERLPVHRHPLPTGAQVGSLAMIVVCARRHGLVASLTRLVSFEPLRPAVGDAYARLARVDATFNRATVPGARVGDVFRAGAAAYAEHGFEREEWRLHHQGGPTGYEPRDYLADAGSDARVEPGQAFAWNPSAPSVKVEDTVLAREDGPEILTVDPRWPTILADGLPRPGVLER